jgi:peptide/nickel transport system permease protein
MLRAAGSRLVALLTLVLLVALASFVLLRALPGDPAYVLLGSEYTPEAYEVLQKQLGLDKPMFTQFFHWLGTVAEGGLGVSYVSHHRVNKLVADGMAITLSVSAISVLLAALFVSVFMVVGLERPRFGIDLGVNLTGIAGYATPSFLTGAALIILIARPTGWFPVLPRVEWLAAPLDTLRGLILPAVTLAVYYGGLVLVTTRSALREAWTRDCMEYARASGLGFWLRVRYAFRLSVPSVVAVSCLSVGQLLSGAVLTETVFGLPGLGRLAAQAVIERDFPVMLPTVML